MRQGICAKAAEDGGLNNCHLQPQQILAKRLAPNLLRDAVIQAIPIFSKIMLVLF